MNPCLYCYSCLARQMSTPKQGSILRRWAQSPPTMEGGIDLSIEISDDQHGVVRLHHGDVVLELNAVGLSVPYPSGLRRLLNYEDNVELVIVDRAPPGFREAVAELGLNYLDIHGRGRVIADGLVYVVSPHPDLGNVGTARSSPFAPKASRVVRVLLSAPTERWRLSDVAVLCHLNPGNVHRALGALVERGMVERDDNAYVVADPGSLLEAWADQHEPPRSRIVYRSQRDVRACVRDIVARLDGDAVVSGEVAAEEFAPHLPAESAIVHCLDADRFGSLPREEAPRWLVPFGVAPGQVLVDQADEGYGEFRSERHGLPLAAPVQVYVDLARDITRGRSAAENLRRTTIGF